MFANQSSLTRRNFALALIPALKRWAKVTATLRVGHSN
jgi:hypothetical protein